MGIRQFPRKKGVLLLTGGQRMDTGGQSTLESTLDSQVGPRNNEKEYSDFQEGQWHLVGPN